ncbi:RNA guanine-N7 methyltransferase activating subunit-like isoform X2 [Cydia fagiglandana]|uniref:RNA guanine-N7 methyltransferase activating subunit-like isoform X2 n=1 Tax=Cydia fagiglandana TaxID=1458189 RepID=UPI002FEE1E03
MATSEHLSDQDQQFLASCEEELKDRYTENDEAFMKVFKAEPSPPPIIESWWVPNNGGRRNDRRFNRRNQPYSRDGRDGRDGRDHGRGRHDHGRHDHSRSYDDRSYGHHSNRPRHY